MHTGNRSFAPPAQCVSICSVGALSATSFEDDSDNYDIIDVSGFPTAAKAKALIIVYVVIASNRIANNIQMQKEMLEQQKLESIEAARSHENYPLVTSRRTLR
jgi:hypothetical protein